MAKYPVKLTIWYLVFDQKNCHEKGESVITVRTTVKIVKSTRNLSKNIDSARLIFIFGNSVRFRSAMANLNRLQGQFFEKESF
jgi:hypothetical protein